MKTKMRPPLEKTIQRQIVNYLKLRGIPHTVTDASRTWTAGGKFIRPRNGVTPGWPDITAVVPRGLCKGNMLCIEVKRPGGKVSPIQRKCILELCDAGALFFCGNSVKDVERKLMDLDAIEGA